MKFFPQHVLPLESSANFPNIAVTLGGGASVQTHEPIRGIFHSNQPDHEILSLRSLWETFRIAHFWQEGKESRRGRNRMEEVSMMFWRHISVLSQSVFLWQCEHIAHSTSRGKEALVTFCFTVSVIELSTVELIAD